MRTLLLLAALALALLGPGPGLGAEAEKYRGFRLLAVATKTAEDVMLLHGLEALYDLDFLNHARSGREARLLVGPAKLEAVSQQLRKAGIAFQVVVEDMQQVINEEQTRNAMLRSSRENGTATFSAYMHYDEITDYLKSLASRYPGVVSLESIGKSFENRDLHVVRVSASGGRSPRAVLVDAGIHAREWIAPATALYLIKELVERHANHTDLLDGLDWYIIPLLNPDGYEHSHSVDRMWRKNRNTAHSAACIGTDLNRNFGFGWSPEIGGSRNPCSMIFSGPKPFSEPESNSLRNFVLKTNSQKHIKMYLTLHSYGSYILFPWGWTVALPPDVDELESIARDANFAMIAAGGPSFTIGSSTSVLYPAAGGSDDWVKGVGEIPKSYTLELPAGGRQGFDMPPNKILETAKMVFQGIRAFAKRAKAL